MSEKITLDKVKIRGLRATLELSTHEEPLVIDAGIAYDWRLAAGTVLTRSQVDRLESAAERFQVRETATRLLALRQHSVGELQSKLRRKGFDPEIAGEVVSDFKERRLLDDAEYARTLAEQVVNRKPCGRAYILAHLRRKQVSSELAAEAADMVLSQHDIADLAACALRQRWREFSQFELETARHKAYNYLARRGFTYDASRAAFDTVREEETNGGQD